MTTVIERDVAGSESIAEFWRAKANVSHDWFMLMYKFRKDAYRRQRCAAGRVSDEYWQYHAELDRAQAIFYAQYLIALACSELTREGISLEHLIACSFNAVELETLL